MVRSRTYIATPPGATIREQLNDRGMSQKEFAVRMNLSEKHVSKLINGEVQLTFEVAVKLETVLGAPANFWNNLEAIYREKMVRVKMENAMDADEVLVKQLPYTEMARFGWVPQTRKSKEKVINLRNYFEVVELSLLENRLLTQIACRRLAITEKSDAMLLAWVQEAKWQARKIETKPIQIKKILSAISEIRSMTRMSPAEFSPRLKTLLAECGIALVFLPHLRGSFLQGASFMDGNKIVLGLTSRGKDADKFWFSFFHELGHIVMGHVGKPDGTTPQDEMDADEWAKDVLIPRMEYIIFVKRGIFTQISICMFAEQIGIAPGIVVGRLQNDGVISHNILNGLKEHYMI